MEKECDFLRDVSLGGVCFIAHNPLEAGTIIQIHIPIVHPRFSAAAKVAWSRPCLDGIGFDTGVEFLDSDSAFRARMVEQVCHIEDYKCKKLAEEGLNLTNEEAALEWIQKHAHEFPLFHRSLHS